MKSLSDSTVAIVGLGLMGGSLALALRDRHVCRTLRGIDCDPSTCAEAEARGLVDAVGPDLALATWADVIVLATPVRTILELLPPLAAAAQPGAVIVDFGSTKREIVQAMNALPDSIQPVGGHPMCGKDTSGLAAADAGLFRGATFVITPFERTAPETLELVQAMATALEARPVLMDPEKHDRLVAATSHLPYAAACALMTALDSLGVDDDVRALASSGLRDTSRLASSNTAMMLDILLTNSDHIADAIEVYSQELLDLSNLVRRKDERALARVLQEAARTRREVFPHG